MPQVNDTIRNFMARGPYAVVGASSDQSKYGNMVLRAYQQQGHEVYPVNPRADVIEGLKAYPSLGKLPVKVPQAIEKGITNIWMQPGAESREGIRKAEALGLKVIAGGPCYLVLAHYHEEP